MNISEILKLKITFKSFYFHDKRVHFVFKMSTKKLGVGRAIENDMCFTEIAV